MKYSVFLILTVFLLFELPAEPVKADECDVICARGNGDLPTLSTECARCIRNQGRREGSRIEQEISTELSQQMQRLDNQVRRSWTPEQREQAAESERKTAALKSYLQQYISEHDEPIEPTRENAIALMKKFGIEGGETLQDGGTPIPWVQGMIAEKYQAYQQLLQHQEYLQRNQQMLQRQQEVANQQIQRALQQSQLRQQLMLEQSRQQGYGYGMPTPQVGYGAPETGASKGGREGYCANYRAASDPRVKEYWRLMCVGN